MKTNHFYYLIFGFLLIGCATAAIKNTETATIDHVKSKYPNYTISEFTQGKILYGEHCNSCHSLKNPTSYSETEWNGILPRMTLLVNEKGPKLNATKQELILKYLVTLSTAPVNK